MPDMSGLPCRQGGPHLSRRAHFLESSQTARWQLIELINEYYHELHSQEIHDRGRHVLLVYLLFRCISARCSSCLWGKAAKRGNNVRTKSREYDAQRCLPPAVHGMGEYILT